MKKIQGIYRSSSYKFILLQLGETCSRPGVKYTLHRATTTSDTGLRGLGWRRIASRHLAVWDD